MNCQQVSPRRQFPDNKRGVENFPDYCLQKEGSNVETSRPLNSSNIAHC